MTPASWTLRADLVGDFVCKLLKHMDAKGKAQVEVAFGRRHEPWVLSIRQ